MRTLRSRLLLGTAIGTTLVLLVSGVMLDALIRDALWHAFDESLAARARSLAAMMEQEGRGLSLEFDEAHLPEFESSEQAEFYQVWVGDTKVRARSASLADRDLERVAGTVDAPGFKSAPLPDGRPGRLVGMTFVPRLDTEEGSGQPLNVTFVLARETAGIDKTLAGLRRTLVAVGILAVLVSVGVLAWSVRRGLRPVSQIADQIADVGESDLSARIDPAGVPLELLPVVDRLNELLARLESAFQREKRFTADVAHELRTPLAGLRAMLEVALSQNRESDEYLRVMGECLTVNQQMHRMVENLLGLARIDACQLVVDREEVDAADLVRECWKPLAAQADKRGLTIDWELQEGCTLSTDRGKLELVLANLLDNAVTHADAGGRVTVACLAQDSQVTLCISNTGSRVPADQAARVFDRFWRGDQARTVSGRHCGLGLSLCREMVTQLGGSISATSALEGEFNISIVLARSSQVPAKS